MSFLSNVKSIDLHIGVKIIVAVATIGVTVKVISKVKQHMKKKRRLQKSLQKSDVVILHQFPRGYKAPSVSPFPLKLETYLRMAKIPYENDFEDFLGPKQKCPYITLNGEDIADSQLIIEFLNKKHGIDLNDGLNEEQVALGHCLRILAENSLYWSTVLFRWVYDKEHQITRLSSFTYLEFLFVKYLIWKQCWSQGAGRHRIKDVMAMAEKDLSVLSTHLGNKKFFLGDEPHEVDCALFGMLGQLVWNFPNTFLERLVNEDYKNLKDFCFRMKEEFWPDWDDCLLKR